MLTDMHTHNLSALIFDIARLSSQAASVPYLGHLLFLQGTLCSPDNSDLQNLGYSFNDIIALK